MTWLQEYIDGHIFIHDDLWIDQPDDHDELSGHPTLLSPPLTISSRTSADSKAPDRIELPGRSPLSSLMAEPQLVAEVVHRALSDQLHLSAFYSDRAELERLAQMIRVQGFDARIDPSPDAYRAHINQSETAFKLAEISPNFPKTTLVRDVAQLASALTAKSHMSGVFIKGVDSRTIFAQNATEAVAYAEEEGFPLVIQEPIPTDTGAVVVHWIQRGASTRPLFVTRQLEKDHHHVGNVYSSEFEAYFVRRYEEQMIRWMTLIPEWTGPVAVDVVVPSDGSDPVPIDLNARFNSSTFPMAHALQTDPNATWTYRRHEESRPPPDGLFFGASLDGTDSVSFSLVQS